MDFDWEQVYKLIFVNKVFISPTLWMMPHFNFGLDQRFVMLLIYFDLVKSLKSLCCILWFDRLIKHRGPGFFVA